MRFARCVNHSKQYRSLERALGIGLFAVVLGSSSLLSIASSPVEILYNGIELPAEWPPRRTGADILSLEPMRVPYLERPPAVVPIDVGRQLFVDDFLIEQTTIR